MDTNLKHDLCQELKGLLADWDGLLAMSQANFRDFERLKDKIDTICGLLDEISRREQSEHV